jgi:hypothetical protein
LFLPLGQRGHGIASAYMRRIMGEAKAKVNNQVLFLWEENGPVLSLRSAARLQS